MILIKIKIQLLIWILAYEQGKRQLTLSQFAIHIFHDVPYERVRDFHGGFSFNFWNFNLGWCRAYGCTGFSCLYFSASSFLKLVFFLSFSSFFKEIKPTSTESVDFPPIHTCPYVLQIQWYIRDFWIVIQIGWFIISVENIHPSFFHDFGQFAFLE